MNQNEMFIFFSSEDGTEGKASLLRLCYLFTAERSYSEKELYPEFCQIFSSFDHEKMIFKNFDELRNFIAHMGMILNKTHYRFVSLSQYHSRQQEFENADHYKNYFNSLKVFKIGKQGTSQKGFFEKILSF